MCIVIVGKEKKKFQQPVADQECGQGLILIFGKSVKHVKCHILEAD